MKNKMMVLLGTAVVVCVFHLSALNAAAADLHAHFNLQGSGFKCLGAQLTLGGQTYTVKVGDTISCVSGGIPSGTSVNVKLQFLGNIVSGCGGPITDKCSGTFTLNNSTSSGTICTTTGYEKGWNSLRYTINQSTSSTCGLLGSWDVIFIMENTTPYAPL